MLLYAAMYRQKQQLAMWKVVTYTSLALFGSSRSVLPIMPCVTAQITAEKEALFESETITLTRQLEKNLTVYSGSDRPARLPWLSRVYPFVSTYQSFVV